MLNKVATNTKQSSFLVLHNTRDAAVYLTECVIPGGCLGDSAASCSECNSFVAPTLFGKLHFYIFAKKLIGII